MASPEGFKRVPGPEQEQPPEKPRPEKEEPRIRHHVGGGAPLSKAIEQTRQIGQERATYEEEMEEKIEAAKAAGDFKRHQELTDELKRKEKESHAQEIEIAKRAAEDRRRKLRE